MTYQQNAYPLLSTIDCPDDLRALSLKQLPVLAHEIRHYLVHTLNMAGGHFASSLGALELTLALHYIYQTPKDKIVWDVGHQTYIHKILTQRKDDLITIKKAGGLSGFPKRSESQYDTFGVGHAGTSISAALGMAEASRLTGSDQKTVAVIGDGALTCGMAFEAMNHAGGSDANLLVILNDNEMSISENVGGLTTYLSKFLAGSHYQQLRQTTKKVFKNIPGAIDALKTIETQAKGAFVPANLFEALGFYYVGPIDGHDIDLLTETLKGIKTHQGPCLLHVTTQKGKGYKQAESDPIGYHHVSPQFHAAESQVKEKPKTYANVFGQWICDQAKQDPQLVGITPAMREGSDLIDFSKQFPDRYFDVAIAEQHAVTFAAGLACEGKKPVVAIYSTFLQRAYDQVIHDVSLQNLDVLYAVDRAGLVGADGATHAGSFDLSFMRCIPNMAIMTPSDEHLCYHMLSLGYDHKGPAMVRYPRGSGAGQVIGQTHDIQWGKGKIIRKGRVGAILNFGNLLPMAEQAANTCDLTLVDMRFVKPLDTDLIRQIARDHQFIITLEENVIAGGAGSAVNEFLCQNDLINQIYIRNLGLPDHYIHHGDKAELLAEIGLSAQGIMDTAQALKEKC